MLQSLAEYMIPLLQPEDLLKELTDLQQKSKDFLKGSVAHELEEIVTSISMIFYVYISFFGLGRSFGIKELPEMDI